MSKKKKIHLKKIVKQKFSKFLSLFVLLFLILSHIFIIPYTAFSAYINTIGIKGDFIIDNDITNTTNTGVTLNNNITGAVNMRFGNTIAERDSASWETFSSTKIWTLDSIKGIKTVYAEFKNASSSSIYVSDDIVYSPNPSLPFSGGLTLWFDADDNNSITQSGGNISQWNDKSGNAYHAKQNILANQANITGNEINFNGTSDYFYLQNLNYTNTAPIDGLLTCTVFRTPSTTTGLSDNWAFLDFDRSEWFNFYSRGDGVGFSYDAGGIQDITVSGVGVNDNNLHVACASYDNTLLNDTIVTIDGNIEFSSDLEGFGSQIGVGQSTRYGFIGDGSEALTENAGRNNTYYDGGIGEILYFDSAVSSVDRKNLECYLGEKWSISVSGCTDTTKPIATVNYIPEGTTSSSVIATLTNSSEPITVTNNSGSINYTFSTNGTFNFEFVDNSGNTGSTLAKVDWIDPLAPPAIGTGSLNEAPNITSYGGSSSQTLVIASGSTNVATISATDTAFNVIGEYGNSILNGNTWLGVNHYEMCSPVVIASHRQDVNGEIQRAPRVRNKTGTGFQIHVDNYNSTIGAISTKIDYIVMNAGSYDFGGGFVFEAGTQTTTAVACNANNSPTPQTVNFTSSFSSPPVVLHTVSTENDSSWTVSGVNGADGTRQSEPTTTKMGTLLQRSFNSCTHASEDIDYFAIEAGNYSLVDGSILDAVRSTDSIASVTVGGNPISFNTPFISTPQTAIVSQLGEDGGNGGYAQIHTGGSTLTTSQVFATIDEDGPSADRTHTSEIASVVAFNNSSGQFWEENTITYSITGGSDSGDFSIDPSSGKLDFITGKSPSNYTDSNLDGIYEVIISACDSHCNSKCDTQTILADVSDNIAPVITNINFASGSLLPGGNHDIIIDYNDAGSGIDVTSDNIQLFKWNGSIWGPDISNSGFGIGAITSTGATYSTNNLNYGKYKYDFSISDIVGNTSSTGSVFYIDTPSFNVSTGSIDMGNLNTASNSFSPEITVTVKTVGAGFSILLNQNTMLSNGLNSIPNWDGSIGFGYDQDLYTGNISLIGIDENLATQVANINSNGELNTYTYKIKVGAIIDQQQSGGNYSGSIDFGINLDY